MKNREQLEQDIERLEEEANSLRRRNDETGYLTKMAEVNGKKAELSAIDISNIAEEVRASEFPFILTVGGRDINFRDWIPQEQNYQVLAIGVSQKLYELNATHSAELSERDQLAEQERVQHANQLMAADQAADARHSELYEQFQALKLELQSVKAERDVLKDEVQVGHQTKLERDEFERKLQAAGNEIESLKNQLVAAQVKDKPVVTNMDSNALTEAIRIANQAKPRIYNKRPGDIRTTFYLATLLETGVEIPIPHLNIGQYVEASEAEVQRFRAELEAAKADIPESVELVSDDLELAEPIEVPNQDSFRDEVQNDDTTNGLGGNTATPEGVQNPDGESFEQETRRRLAVLEAHAFGEVKAVA